MRGKITKATRVRRNKERLEGILGQSPRLDVASALIDHAAWQAVELEDLRQEVEATGWTEEYQNGANQSGTKKSSAGEAYIQLSKVYLATIKQLVELAPEAQGNNEIAEFMRLASVRKAS